MAQESKECFQLLVRIWQLKFSSTNTFAMNHANFWFDKCEQVKKKAGEVHAGAQVFQKCG